MKGMDLFCSSPATTAVRSSFAHNRSRRSFHQRQSPKTYAPCSSSRMPIIPLPYQKSRRSTDDCLRRKSFADVRDLRSSFLGSSSSRYLLSDKPFVDDNCSLEDKKDRVLDLVPVKERLVPLKTKHLVSSNDHSPTFKSSSSARSRDQVVVLRVSIYCKGCERKVRKHISKMEGVTSFSIDLEQKKVTVVGDVTPLGVLNGISKVKNAELWPSSLALSTP